MNNNQNNENVEKLQSFEKQDEKINTNDNDKIMDLVFVLDKSGSMYNLTQDTIGGFNSLIDKHKEENPNTLVTLVLFNTTYKVIYNRKPITEVEKLTCDVYYPSGCTALLDAVGTTINRLDRKTSDNVLFVISTDGLENSSIEFTRDDIKNMISNHQWEFIFLGANIDSFSEAQSLGISYSRTVNFEPNSRGVNRHWSSLSKATRSVSRFKSLDDSDWKEDLE